MLLSVVIPFYRVEAYLGACLERASRLPREECELLLVDDCGDDASLSIAQAFAERHANARVLRREKNGGLSAARNTGLDAARGEYVYFLDSDDLPEPDALWRLVCRAKDEALDVAKARFTYLDDDTGRRTPGPAIPQTRAMAGGALFAAQCRAGCYEPMVWQCVYRRAFLEETGLRMADGLLFEDELFQTSALLSARRAAASEESILLYRRREGSIMASFARSSRWCESYLAVCRRLRALAEGETAADPAARVALQKRVGQIALGVGKNIVAYSLTGEVRREAEEFLSRNRRELAGLAMGSGDPLVAAQGVLLGVSPGAFMGLYAKAMGKQEK